jgi:hypothetical protein
MKPVVPVVLALAGLLVVLTTAAVVRGRVRELKGHFDHCKEMCSPGQRTVAATGDASCRGMTG